MVELLLVMLLFVAGPVSADRAELERMGSLPVPPAMPVRSISPPATQPAGEILPLVDGDVGFTLFLPPDFKPADDGTFPVTVHFHTVVWFVVDEHLRRGIREPLVIFTLGEGSSTYRKPFEDRERFGRVLSLVETTLRQRLGTPGAKISRVDITSFSAGYGAVREIVKEPQYVNRIRRIVLCDSMYAGWEPASTQPVVGGAAPTSRPAEENIGPWLAFVRAAARGEKTFVLTHSMVPTPRYASSSECAQELISRVGATRREIKFGETEAARDDRYPLIYRADLGHFHVWGYAGEDAGAHMTHVRHLAEVWKALDAVGDR